MKAKVLVLGSVLSEEERREYEDFFGDLDEVEVCRDEGYVLLVFDRLGNVVECRRAKDLKTLRAYAAHYISNDNSVEGAKAIIARVRERWVNRSRYR